MRKRKNRFLLTTSLIIGILLIILLISYFITQSSWFLDFGRKTLISQVNKQINGTLEIGSLQGNIFNNLTLHDLVLIEENSELEKSEIIYLKELELKYDLGFLLQKKIIINSILLSELTVNLHQNDKGSWNVTNIPLPKDTTKTDKTSSSWQIEVESLIVSNSKVKISGENLPELLPHEISISQLISQASLGKELKWKLSKAELAVLPQEITFSLNDLQGNDKMDITLKQLDISSAKSHLQLTGYLINQPLRKANLSFEAKPLSFTELKTWLPSFPLQGNPTLLGELQIRGDSLSTEITLYQDDQLLKLQAQLANLQVPLTALLNVAWENIDINSWQNELPKSDLTGNIVAAIEGETWPQIETELTLKLKDSEFNSYKIYTFSLESKGSPAHLKNTLNVKSEFGEIAIKADLDSLLSEIGYVMSGSIKDVDLLKIIPTLPYQSEINSDFSISGKGIDPKKLDLAFQVNLAGSSFADEPLEKLKLIGKYNRGNYNLKELAMIYDGLDLAARGKGNIYGNNELSYNLQLKTLPQIVQELQPDLALKATVSGRARGKLNDLVSISSIDLEDIKYQDYEVTSVKSEVEVRLLNKKPQGNVTATITKIEMPALAIDSIWINAKYAPEKAFLDLKLIQSDTLGVRLTGDIYPNQSRANFTKLEINALGQNWHNRSDDIKINYNPNKLSLQGLELSSDTQVITANLTLDSKNSYDINVKFDSLAIWPLRYLNPALETINGKLSLNIIGKGELSNPEISASWDLDNLFFKGITLNKIRGNLDYENQVAQIDLDVNRSKEESITVKGFLPLQANISKKEFKLLKDEPLKFDLEMTPLDLSEVEEYSGYIKGLKGKLNLTAKIEKTLNHPQMDAKLLLEDAAIKYSSLGINYSDINLDFEAHNNRLELKELTIPSGKNGHLKVTGSTILNLQNNQLDSLRISLKAQDWQALNSKDMDLEIDSNLQITGTSSKPNFSGYLNVLRARLNLQALLGREKKQEPLTRPLLLVGSTNENQADNYDLKEEKAPLQIMKNLRGDMKISFPQNVWIKSKEMNVELGGEIEIIKNSPDFVLSGNVMVVRGNYTAYGRRFNINSGNIYFQGERDINPRIDVLADYTLRNSAQEQQTLSVQVTGTLKLPVIQFLLDGNQISEGDGVSYIVFGKSTAELSSGEKNQIDNPEEDNMATQIVVNQLASRLTALLQNSFNLDVIELKGDGNWRHTQVVVGKYLTNNLFLSYERELSFDEKNEVIPEKITLEYEITRRIFLQATQGGEKDTGIDFIFKFKK